MLKEKVTTWVLVADGIKAIIMKNDYFGDPLEVIPDGLFIGKNKMTHEIGSERPGRSFDSTGSHRHAMVPGIDWQVQEKELFAKELGDFLNDARNHNKFQKLVIIAPPKTLGDLRKELHKNTAELVIEEIGKDLTNLDTEEVKERVLELIKI